MNAIREKLCIFSPDAAIDEGEDCDGFIGRNEKSRFSREWLVWFVSACWPGLKSKTVLPPSSE